MRITYDEHKRQINIAKHRLDFADLTLEFFEASRIETAKHDRSLAIGRFRGLVIAVIFSPLGSEAIAIISMRHASEKERQRFNG